MEKSSGQRHDCFLAIIWPTLTFSSLLSITPRLWNLKLDNSENVFVPLVTMHHTNLFTRQNFYNCYRHFSRSTPCPQVKSGDEWGDPVGCDSGDGCQYCHTRTEQQFHPEIYKSTKCNDIQNTSYCPRGAFCAFAHIERKLILSTIDIPKHAESWNI